jgi:hypothetical protein
VNFLTAFDKLLKHEGDYSDHKDDPGGKTRYGITEAVAREVGYRGDMRELPLDLAQRKQLLEEATRALLDGVATSICADGETQIHSMVGDLPTAVGLYEIGKHMIIQQEAYE